MRTDHEIADGYVAWRRAKDTPDEESLFWAFEEMCTVVAVEPERALRVIAQVLERDDTARVVEILAAGPLEDLLSGHGPQMIDAIESEARRNPKFAFLLGGVWQSDIDAGVWRRVELVRVRSGWDGNP